MTRCRAGLQLWSITGGNRCMASALPMATLVPRQLSVGDRVLARDVPARHWYPAKVIEKVRGPRLGVKVTFDRFPSTHDKILYAADKALRPRVSAAEIAIQADQVTYENNLTGRLPDGTWLVERLLQKKIRRGKAFYLVRWQGWDDSYNTWESNLDREIIEEFEEETLALAAARAKKPVVPKVPFSVELTAHESKALKEQRLVDVQELLACPAEETAVKFGRKNVPKAEFQVASLKGVSAGDFVAMQEHFFRRAKALNPQRKPSTVVEPITALRSGDRPVDNFAVLCDDVLNELIGEGVFKIHSQTNSAAAKMVPPLDFFLRARRAADGTIMPVKELVWKAHFVTLISDHAHPGAPIFRADDAAFTYPPDDLEKYKAAMARCVLAAGAAATAEFRAWAQTHVE